MRRTPLALWLLAALLGVPLMTVAAEVTKFPVPVGDITLNNGKVFHSVVVLSQTSAAISVKHTGGLTKIEKQLLPPELLARFPVNQEMAAQEQQAQQDAQRRRAEELSLAAQKRSEQAAKAEEQKAAARARQAAAGNQPGPATPSRAVGRISTQQEQLAQAPFGLFIVDWFYMTGNNVSVNVSNPTATTQKLDPRQLTGLVLESGQTVTGVDLKFQVNEAANQWVDAGQQKSFRVVFSSPARLAAVSWSGAPDWRVSGPVLEAATAGSADEAIRLARDFAVAAKETARINANQRAANSANQEANKSLINK